MGPYTVNSTHLDLASVTSSEESGQNSNRRSQIVPFHHKLSKVSMKMCRVGWNLSPNIESTMARLNWVLVAYTDGIEYDQSIISLLQIPVRPSVSKTRSLGRLKKHRGVLKRRRSTFAWEQPFLLLMRWSIGSHWHTDGFLCVGSHVTWIFLCCYEVTGKSERMACVISQKKLHNLNIRRLNYFTYRARIIYHSM
jgi:hypothetical protein